MPNNNLTFMRRFPFYRGGRKVPVVNFREHVFIEESPENDKFICGPAITRLAAYETLGMEPHELAEMIAGIKEQNTVNVTMLECKVCGMKFDPGSKRCYTVIKSKNIFNGELYLGDAFDCPKCGCQIVVGERCIAYEEEE